MNEYKFISEKQKAFYHAIGLRNVSPRPLYDLRNVHPPDLSGIDYNSIVNYWLNDYTTKPENNMKKFKHTIVAPEADKQDSTVELQWRLKLNSNGEPNVQYKSGAGDWKWVMTIRQSCDNGGLVIDRALSRIGPFDKAYGSHLIRCV